jgi:phosphoglycerate dehydrogenase-like enzyme
VKILIQYPFTAAQIESFAQLAAENGGHEVIQASTEAEAVAVAPQIEVILGDFLPAVCAAAPNLRWIQSYSTGMDKFLFAEMIERDAVMVSNVAGLYASQGAEHAWALLLALARGLPAAWDNQAKRAWAAGPVIELSGSTLGIVGMGGFGIEMVKRAAGYDMTILAIDAGRRFAPAGVAELKPATKENLHSLLHRSDIVMIACPLTKETYHLIGPAELAVMKQSAYLINVTRGGIIDEPALIAALQAGRIAGAGLDVTEKEPLPADNPLWAAPNLIITPHRAGASQHRPRKVFEFFMQNLERYLNGKRPLNVIDKRRGY